MTTEGGKTGKEEISFTADISQLMNLIINSFYSKKEIFLRELLSNASDALEKIRHQSLVDKNVLEGDDNLKVQVKVDKEAKTLTIRDNGIGMTRDDLINCLGTIAKSGTKAFIENLGNSKDVETIGQFGVGFYSSYLVADKVKVITKHNDDEEYTWESNSDKKFSLEVNNIATLTRGTEITLYIKEDEEKYLETNTVKEIIKTYTEFINYPIEIWETKEVNEQEPEQEAKEPKEELDEPLIEDVVEDIEKNKETTKTWSKKEVSEWVQINDEKPIWTLKPENVTDEQYKSFYKKISGDYGEPLTQKHFHTEGQLECNCLLYIPEKQPFDMFETGKKKKNIKLYVKKVFIMDDCDELLPEWLKFVKGVVDSNDIPLNVSREILQQNKIIKQIKNVIVKKVIELITELSDDDEKFNKFYESYSKMLKLGVHEDSKNRDKLVELLRFYSSKDKEKLVTLKEYVEEMKEEQSSIYYICGDNKDVLSQSPLIEKIRKKGYNVLYFTDTIDEYMVQNVREYNNKKLVDVSKEGIKFDEDNLQKMEEDNKDFMAFIKETLGGKVSDVKITDRLQDTPCVLVTAEFGWTANMERIMKAQALRDNNMDTFMSSKKIMELNMEHIILRTLKEKSLVENEKSACVDVIKLLYDNALLGSGFVLEDPNEYAKKVNRMIEIGFCDEEVNTTPEIDNINESTEENTEENTQETHNMEEVD
jgi:molecular chaperone HtpG